MWFYEPGASQYLPMETYVSSEFLDVSTGMKTTQSKNGKLTYVFNKDGEVEFRMEGMNSYAICNINGNVIVNTKTKNDTETVSIADLPAGLYILKIIGTKGTENVKFMKR